MRTYKSLALIAAAAITALELVVFAHTSEVAPQLETQRSMAWTQGASVNAPSIDSSGDGGRVSGE